MQSCCLENLRFPEGSSRALLFPEIRISNIEHLGVVCSTQMPCVYQSMLHTIAHRTGHPSSGGARPGCTACVSYAFVLIL